MQAYMTDKYGANRSSENGFQDRTSYRGRSDMADPLVNLLKHQASVDASVAVQKQNAQVAIENYKTDQHYSLVGWTTGIFGL